MSGNLSGGKRFASGSTLKSLNATTLTVSGLSFKPNTIHISGIRGADPTIQDPIFAFPRVGDGTFLVRRDNDVTPTKTATVTFTQGGFTITGLHDESGLNDRTYYWTVSN